ncbi:glycosyltransferase family 2 protein [Parasediminibacterium sp. JCM 36343]|uniref:glycosyltransferase family 2 protein n=1 Tax=Parasediminibacterium sp. JCM 36343 TaxID=3374279 RepID=UPI00397E002E
MSTGSNYITVSIITATYNSAATIADTLHAVQSQTYPHIEHIIVDGLSTDNTIQLVKSSNHKGIITEGKDAGIYDAMNKGIGLANGEIVGILNSDDFYPDATVIEKVVALFKETGCDAVYGDLVYVDAIDTAKIKRNWVSGAYKRDNFLYGWMPPHPTFFVKKEVYYQYGLFNISLWGAADYELMLRFLYKHSISVAYLPKVLVHMRAGGQSNHSLFNRLRANREDRKAWRLNGLKPYWYTLLLKPLRKISQFFIKD